jgi:hypothetical protein
MIMRHQCDGVPGVSGLNTRLLATFFLPTTKMQKATIDVPVMIEATGTLFAELKIPTPADDNPAIPI